MCDTHIEPNQGHQINIIVVSKGYDDALLLIFLRKLMTFSRRISKDKGCIFTTR